MAGARSNFTFGGQEFIVPTIHPTVLHEIREFGRDIDKSIPNVERIVVVADILAMLKPSYQWLTAEWLNANLTTETAAGLIENLTAQMELAIAARKAAPMMPAADAARPN